jgi:hypothetical protein
MVLRWTASSGHSFTVERSEDLAEWHPVELIITEAAPGVYTAVLPVSPSGSAFYRLRLD